jgi:hypothetical protein
MTIATMADARTATADLLSDFGIEIGPGGLVVFADIVKAERCYVHHSSMPVALTAFALASPAFARGRFPKTRLVDLVVKRPCMDEREARALAAVCGENLDLTGPRAFIDQLERVRIRYGLDHLFGHDLAHPGCNGITLRPFGFDWRTGKVEEPAMRKWRSDYRGLPFTRQIMAATVLTLYRGMVDKTWLHRQPHGWHAADAVAILKGKALLRDWGKLVALYPGW